MNTSAQQRLKPILITTMLASLVTACANPNSTPDMSNKPTTVNNPDLTSMNWQLVSTAQKGKAAKTVLNAGPQADRFNFSFKDGRLSIRGGCNSLSGSYKLSAGSQIAIGPMMGTKKACAREIMEADNEILSYLNGLSNYSINGRALTLSTAFQQRLTLKGTPAAETRYGGKGMITSNGILK